MQKQNRNKLYRYILESRDVQTREELLDLMNQNGAGISQAQLNLDIRDLGIAKRINDKGLYTYQFPHHGIINVKEYINSANLSSMVFTVQAAGNLVLVKTYTAAASAVAAALDASEDPEILATIAGFDTVLVVTKDTETAQRISDKIRSVVY